jgi:hypothetical protein
LLKRDKYEKVSGDVVRKREPTMDKRTAAEAEIEALRKRIDALGSPQKGEDTSSENEDVAAQLKRGSTRILCEELGQQLKRVEEERMKAPWSDTWRNLLEDAIHIANSNGV